MVINLTPVRFDVPARKDTITIRDDGHFDTCLKYQHLHIVQMAYPLVAEHRSVFPPG